MSARESKDIELTVSIERVFGEVDGIYGSPNATGPDQIWVGDVTYLRVNDEWRYLAVILDLFSRKVVGWSLSKLRNVDLSLAAFKAAAKKRLVQPGLYFQSDRGAEYLANFPSDHQTNCAEAATELSICLM
jgi:transposase InsO family protein